ncbi:Serine/threonine-protein kinase Nek8, partial [Stegodyphus mimosarum]
MSRKDILQPRILAALFSYNIKSIACGPRHVLALSDENDVFAWGYNTHGCLGLKKAEFQIYPLLVNISSKSKLEKVFCGVDCSFLITDDKSLLACGNNRHNKLGMDSGEGYQVEEVREFTQIESEPLSECRIVSISAGKSHTLFLCENGEVFSVGSNHYFQLGCGKSGLDYSLPQRIEKLENFNIIQVACCDFYSMAVSEDNYLFCWGKYPSCLEEKKDSEFCDVEIPSFFKEKIVTFVSCNSENCLVIGEHRCSSK